MATPTKVSSLSALAGASVDAADLLYVVDTSAGASGSKNITFAEFLIALGATFQPLDSDLTAIAALTTTSFGRALLALADGAAVRTAIGAGTGTVSSITSTDNTITIGSGTGPTANVGFNLGNANIWSGQQAFLTGAAGGTPAIFRQTGGTVGTHELQISHNGTNATLLNGVAGGSILLGAYTAFTKGGGGAGGVGTMTTQRAILESSSGVSRINLLGDVAIAVLGSGTSIAWNSAANVAGQQTGDSTLSRTSGGGITATSPLTVQNADLNTNHQVQVFHDATNGWVKTPAGPLLLDAGTVVQVQKQLVIGSSLTGVGVRGFYFDVNVGRFEAATILGWSSGTNASAAPDSTLSRTSGSGLTVAQTAGTGTVGPTLTLTDAAHTALTASTERIAVNLNTSSTKQFATGALTTQREVVIQAPTYAGVGTMTITEADTLYVKAPIAGTNVTLTRSNAIVSEGPLVVRQAGGTRELQFSNDGSDSTINQTVGGQMFFKVAGVIQGKFDGGTNFTSIGQVRSSAAVILGGGDDTGIKRLAGKVICPVLGSGETPGGWFQNTNGRSRLTADVTNATATFANISDSTWTSIAGRKYTCLISATVNNSQAAEGCQIDWNGGSGTWTSVNTGIVAAMGCTVTVRTGAAIATALVITALPDTNDVDILLRFSGVANAAGTVIMRAAEVSHTLGTLTVRINSFEWIEDTP